LKPDVCRRVVGRQNQPSALSRQPSAKPKATTRTEAGSPLSRSKGGVAYLVRSLRTCARIRSLTTGTFNLVVKDRIAVEHPTKPKPGLSGTPHSPPERREFSPAGDTQVRRRPSSKPYKHTVRRKTLSIAHPTEFPRDFHNGKRGREAASGSCRAIVELRSTGQPRAAVPTCAVDAQPRATVWPSASAQAFWAARGGRQKIEKRTYVWRFLALKVPFRGLTASESHPVAGIIRAKRP